MSVNNAVYVRSFLLDAHVHLDLRGRLKAFVSLENVALCIDLAYVFRGHEALADAGRVAEKFVFVQFGLDFAVVGSDHASVVDSLADLTDLFFDFVLCCHFGYSFNLKIFLKSK